MFLFPGTASDERDLHYELMRYRCRREWFDLPEGVLAELIEYAAGHWREAEAAGEIPDGLREFAREQGWPRELEVSLDPPVTGTIVEARGGA